LPDATYFLNLLFNDATSPSLEMPLSSMAGHPYFEHMALLAIQNEKGSNVDLIIKRITIKPLTTQSTSLPTLIEFRRVTALSGGTDIAVVKMDTNIPNLPPQILVRKNPSLTVSSVFHRGMNMQTLNFTAALRLTASKWLGKTIANLNQAEQLRAGYIDTQTQGWVFREGEGFALNLPAIPLTNAYQFNCLFSTEDGTYFFSETIRPEAVTPILGLFNGSTSGKTVTVKQFEIQEIGDDTLPYFTIEKIDGLRNGESITPEKMDTSNASLPTQIKIYKNPVVLLAGHKLGAIMINPSFRRAIQQIYGTGPGFSGVDLSGVNYTSKTLDNYKTDIRLKEGQGLAIIKKSASEIGKFEIHVEFTKMDLGTGGPPPDVAYPIIGGGHIIQVEGEQ